MAVVAMKQLLEAGVHFGHQTRRWDPKMAEYIFQARNGIHIIDLQKTSKKLDEAYKFIKEQTEEGKIILFVGTKKQAQECVKEAAEKCEMYYIDQRWLGGMLTNFHTIKNRIKRLKRLEEMETDGTFEVLPKKEVAGLRNEKDKLQKNLGGIKNMESLPGVLFIVDPKKEKIAILEARRLKIPVVGLVDTNCNPEDVDYVIPGNDDAIRAVKLITDVMANAVIEAKQGESADVLKQVFDPNEEGEAIPESIEEVVATAEETPVVKEKVEEAPVVEEKAVETPVVKEKAVETPVVEEKAVETPVVKEKTVEAPVVEAPAVKEKIEETTAVKEKEDVTTE